MKKSNHTPEKLISKMERGKAILEGSLHENLGKDAIPALQGIMQGQAEKLYPIPKRFQVNPGSNGLGNNVDIVDTLTGKSVNVGLCDYHGARKVLGAFFEGDIQYNG